MAEFEAAYAGHAADVKRMLEAMETDGFVLIRGSVPPNEVRAACDMIDNFEPLAWDFTGVTDHYENVSNRDPFWLTFLERPGVIDLAEAARGSDCHIIGETAWRSHPQPSAAIRSIAVSACTSIICRWNGPSRGCRLGFESRCSSVPRTFTGVLSPSSCAQPTSFPAATGLGEDRADLRCIGAVNCLNPYSAMPEMSCSSAATCGTAAAIT